MQRLLMPLLFVALIALAGCAKDLIMDLGHGDSIRLVGQAESFECDDPKYAHADKVRTTQLRFADGTTMWLCMTREDLARQKPIEIASSARSTITVTGKQPPQRAPFKPSLPEDPAAPIVHAIGVYQTPRGGIAIDVRDDSRPLILALSAYNKAHWTLKVADGVKIEKIVLSGYHAQTISGMAPDVPIEVYTYEPSPCRQCTQGSGYFFAYDYPHKRIEELTGQAVNTFQGRYESGLFIISAQQ